MTSHEKNNWFHIQKILEENNWFGRPADSFRLFVQPLVPAVNGRGEWVWTAPWKPLLKPGGHGAIWKLAKDQGILDWFRSLGRKYALIRQVNNPLAGLDYGLLAFTGIGVSGKMSFGFASCPRVIQSAEGVNVLIEKKTEAGYSYVISNVEYCDFLKCGIEDRPLKAGEPYSRFASNTNILFASLDALEQAIAACPFPGLLINVKKTASWHEPIGRLESTMQNIADAFVEESRQELAEKRMKKVFVTYNVRHKTISTAKKAFQPGGSLLETPEHCFYDLMRAYRELLEQECGFKLPLEKSLEETLRTHPAFICMLHPSLGPLFSEIKRKIRSGSIALGSELCIDAAHIQIEGLELNGSLSIEAEEPLGTPRFSEEAPRCILKDVRVFNEGVDWTQSRPFWRHRYRRNGELRIALKGNGEFIAEGVDFSGNFAFEVLPGERVIATQKKGKLSIRKEPIPSPLI